MLEVSESKLGQYVVHYVSDTLVLGEESFLAPKSCWKQPLLN